MSAPLNPRTASTVTTGLVKTIGRMPLVLLIPVVVGGAVAVGVGALVTRLGPQRDGTPAPAGTLQLTSRLPISLWPSDGSEPRVEHGLRGWRAMAARLYHRDTRIDDAARARAVVIAEHPRREVDARREIALEAHILRGSYEPALIAAAWLHPMSRDSESRLRDLAAFGLSDLACATLRASARLDADPELSANWRRELGMQVVRPEVTEAIVGEVALAPDRRAMLWAVILELAESRVSARQVLRRGA
ncbi:hypothetical protein BH11ACT3_BH11ACT3_23210 [soil metagenome]